jgi:uncharacterized membrane protein HdeD (DUF308 family)
MSETATATEKWSSVWWLVLIQGITVLILGILLLVAPIKTTIVLVTFLGIYWLVAGVLAIISIFAHKEGVSWIWRLLVGILGIVAGVLVLAHPLASTILLPTTLVIILGIWGLIMGIVSFIGGLKGDGLGSIVLGLLYFVIGIVLLTSPFQAALVLPIALGLLAIAGGIILIIVAFRARRLTKSVTSPLGSLPYLSSMNTTYERRKTCIA